MANEQQHELWNGCAGAAWIEAQPILDAMFRPFEERLVSAAVESRATRVLDIGCGTGATTLALARALATGKVTGIDLSRPMIELARARAVREGSGAAFVVADAQTHELGAGEFDLIVSRFGVMFFEDPVRAFANLRRAAATGAALRCLVFRSAAENPFMTAAERAAAPLLPNLVPRRVDGPGQFAFADARRVEGILGCAGWTHIGFEPIDVTCVMPAGELDRYLLKLGPVGIALRQADEATRERVSAAVRAAFAPFVHGDEVRFTAACWDIAARS